MSVPAHSPTNHYVMVDQTSAKIRSIMDEGQARRRENAGNRWEGTGEGPMLSRPGWVAITLLVIAFNLMAVLPPAA